MILIAHKVVPHALQHVVMRCNCGIARQEALDLNAVPGLHCTTMCCNSPGMTRGIGSRA